MKKIYIQFSILLGVLFSALPTFGQCDFGEVDTWIIVYSYDGWAEETYWEIVPGGNGCGNGTLVSGSNEEVGCGIGGPTGENGMPDGGAEFFNLCLTEGQAYDLYFFDSFGDGGLAFDVYQNGILTGMYFGTGAGNLWSFEAGVYPFPSYDTPCGASQILPDGENLNLETYSCISAFSEINPPGLACGPYGMWCEGDATQTAWAYFIAEGGKTYEISTCNGGTNFDTQIAIWKSDDCGNMWDAELISANDNVWGGCNESNPYTSTCFAGCLEAGAVYFIQIDGYYGQTGNVELSVVTYDGPTYLETQVFDVICPALDGTPPTGAIYPSVFGIGSDFSCVWTGSGGFSSTAQYINNVQPGTYFMQLTTACGEQYTDEYVINQPTLWDVEISTSGTSCPDAQNGVISVDASGATPGYTYYYDGPGFFAGEGQTLSNAILGNYIVVVTDANGCTYVEEVNVSTSDDLTIEIGPDTTICMGEELIIEGPDGLNYLWGDGFTGQNYTFNSNDWDEGVAALILTAWTDDGCSDSDVALITIEECVNIEEMSSGTFVLYPNPAIDEISILSNTNGATIYEIYDLQGSLVQKGSLNSNPQTIQISSLQAGLYTLRLTNTNEVLDNSRFIVLR
jgi:hypothetical protein